MKNILLAIAMALLLSGCGEGEDKKAVARAIAEDDAAAKQRFERWAYVALEKNISPNETLKLLVVPGKYESDFSDTKCLIYINSEYKTSQLVCPDADRENIIESMRGDSEHQTSFDR